MNAERLAELEQQSRDYLASQGIHVTDEGLDRAGAVLVAATTRLSPADRAVLRRGPAAWRAHLAERDTDT